MRLPQRSSWAISSIIAQQASCSLVEKLSPVCEQKSIKNPVEIAGLKEAHLKDSVALAKYFCWLEEAMDRGDALDEVSVADELEGLRREQEGFMGLSFETISSYGKTISCNPQALRPALSRKKRPPLPTVRLRVGG